MPVDDANWTFSFAGHETFVFRYGWLTKAVEATLGNGKIFGEDNAIVDLGVGKNMVRSIRYWGLATGILEEEPRSRGTFLKPSILGVLLFGPGGCDRFLEDLTTLWILHWNILNNEARCTTWRWAFSMFPSIEFTRDALVNSLLDAIRHAGIPQPSAHSVRRDVDVFVRTYLPARTVRSEVIEDTLECPLTELELLDELGGTSVFQLRRGPKPTLSDQAFAYAVADYWSRVAAGREAISFTELAYGLSSPGNAFKLDENSLIERLEKLEETTGGDMAYVDTAGLKQVYLQPQCTRSKFEYLRAYYETAMPLSVAGV